MARKRILVTIPVVLGGFVLVVCVWSYLSFSEPEADMRARADAIRLPSDFVLVTDKYSPGAMGLFGSLPDLERTYHAPWPGLCDSLRAVRDRSGPESGLAQPPRDLADRMCNYGALTPAGWRGWIRSYRTYDLRLYGREGGMLAEARHTLKADTVSLSREQLEELYPEMFFPPGHAKVTLQLIAHRWQ
jgi:hypothetical protein